MIKAIIFDNNGVLTSCDNDTTVPRFADYFGVDTEYLRPIFHKVVEAADRGAITTEEFFERLATTLRKKYQPQELWEILLSCYQPKQEMRELLLSLKGKYDLALLTNFVDCFDTLNENLWNYEEIFEEDKVFVSSKLHLAKPDTDFYQYATERLGVNPGEVIFVDDREANLVPARELGMKTILFHSPEQCREDLAKILEVNL